MELWWSSQVHCWSNKARGFVEDAAGARELENLNKFPFSRLSAVPLYSLDSLLQL